MRWLQEAARIKVHKYVSACQRGSHLGPGGLRKEVAHVPLMDTEDQPHMNTQERRSFLKPHVCMKAQAT